MVSWVSLILYRDGLDIVGEILGGGGYARTILRVFTTTGARKQNLMSLKYVLKYYPRVYKLIMDTVAKGECPLCGRPITRQFALAPHVRGQECSGNWFALAKSMYGKNRLSEDGVLELINSIRRSYGAPPLSFND